MVTIAILAIFLIAAFLTLAVSIVAYDIYSAARLRWLLAPFGAPHRFRITKRAKAISKFEATPGARGVAHERRPKTPWAARFASLEQKP